MEDVSRLIQLIAEQLRRIQRPVIRQEFSFMPMHESIADKFGSISLSAQMQPELILLNHQESLLLINALDTGLMDVSDCKAILYILMQIDDD